MIIAFVSGPISTFLPSPVVKVLFVERVTSVEVDVVLAVPPFIRFPASSLKSQAAVPLVVLQRAEFQASADIAMPSGMVLVALVVVATPGQVKERGMEMRDAPVTFRSPATVRVCDGEEEPIPTLPS